METLPSIKMHFFFRSIILTYTICIWIQAVILIMYNIIKGVATHSFYYMMGKWCCHVPNEVNYFPNLWVYCDIRHDFRIKAMVYSSIPPVLFRGVHGLFTLFVFVCAKRCPTHIMCFCFNLLHLVYLMLSVSMDCPF